MPPKRASRRRPQRRPPRKAVKRRVAAKAAKRAPNRVRTKPRLPVKKARPPRPAFKAPPAPPASEEPAATSFAPAEPMAEPAPTPAPELVRGSPEWMALDESVRRVESAFSLRFEQVHRRLDDLGMRGRSFSEILSAVARSTGMPEFYAWMVVRSYPGYESDDTEAMRLRTYLRSRKR